MSFTLRTTPELDALLNALSNDLGRSKHDVTLLAIQSLAARHGRAGLIAAIDDETSVEFDDALRRLGE